jgi:hypothetical protein
MRQDSFDANGRMPVPVTEPPGPADTSFSTDGESLVTDDRALLRPAQVVEGRLASMLHQLPVLVSQFERSARPRYR